MNSLQIRRKLRQRMKLTALIVGTTTLLCWLKRQEVEQASARLQQATGAAGVTILKLMTDPSVPPGVRLRSAKCIFDYAFKGIEVEDIDMRVAELEQTVKEARPVGTSHLGLVS